MSQIHVAPPKTTDLCDASDEIQVIQLPFLSFGRRSAFAGHVRTVRYTDGLAELRDLINEPGEDHVLLIDGGGVGWRALFGDVMAAISEKRGWEGVIVNGMIRDVSEIDQIAIGVKALGVVPQRAEIGQSGERDIPVRFGNVTVRPGQRVVADRDGVVVLPPGMHESDIDTIKAIMATARYVKSNQS